MAIFNSYFDITRGYSNCLASRSKKLSWLRRCHPSRPPWPSWISTGVQELSELSTGTRKKKTYGLTGIPAFFWKVIEIYRNQEVKTCSLRTWTKTELALAPRPSLFKEYGGQRTVAFRGFSWAFRDASGHYPSNMASLRKVLPRFDPEAWNWEVSRFPGVGWRQCRRRYFFVFFY